MSPSKPKSKARKPARKSAGKKAKRPAAGVKRASPARRKAAPAKKAVAPQKAPPPWTADIRDLNLVWYNVSDWDRAKRFYGETLGLPVAVALDDVGWVEYGRALPHLAINRWSQPGPVPVSGGGVATLTCPDVRGAVARLRLKGVRCDEVQEMPGMVILGTIYDPDGNKIQLAQSLTP